jgi:ATP-dependent Clp protease protease subunit
MKLPLINLPTNRPKGLRFDVPTVEGGTFDVSNKSDGTATISIFDVIGMDVTAPRIAAALRSIGDRPVTLQVNSPGGSYYEGVAIYNVLRGHSKPITAQVLGIAASAASTIVMAADTIQIARNAEIMIHNAEALAIGDADTMAEAATWLGNINQAIAETYSLRTGIAVDRALALMKAETFMPSAQAIALGFADELLDRDADAKPTISNSTAPQSKRQLEEGLRQQLGFSKAIAARAAAAAWPAVTNETPETIDRSSLIALLREQATAISRSST